MALLLVLVAIVYAVPEEIDTNREGENILNLPILEYECFYEFSNESQDISFALRRHGKAPNIGGNATKIVINSADEMCEYTEDPRGCYECITLKRYGLWEGRENYTRDHGTTEETTNTSNWRNILLTILILGSLIIAVLIIITTFKKTKIKKAKDFKHKNK